MSFRAMDNFQFMLRSYGDEDLKAALDFLMGSKEWPQKATHWCVIPGPTTDDEPRDYIVFFWAEPENKGEAVIHRFPAPLTSESAFPIINFRRGSSRPP